MMQKCFRNVLAVIPAAGLAFVGSAVAQQPVEELSRKEWKAYIERAQSRLEQLRQDGKIADGSELNSEQSVASREAREEWQARVDAARKRVEQLRASRETADYEEIALKEDDPKSVPPPRDRDDIRVGTIPTANMVRLPPSEAGNVQQSNVKPSPRGEPGKQAGSGRELKPDGRVAKQVRKSQRISSSGSAVRDPAPARGMQVSSAAVATAPSCTSFWGCLKQAVGIR